MPRKPEPPRPDRRYNPVSTEFPLDRLKSASAIVAPPGFGILPFSLASLLGEPGRTTRAPVAPIPAVSGTFGSSAGEPTVGHSAGGGGGAADVISGTPAARPSAAAATVVLPTAPRNEANPFTTHSDTDTSGSGGGALRGRGGSNATSGVPRPSAASMQPFSGAGSGSRAFGFSFNGGTGGSANNSTPTGAAGSNQGGTTVPPAIAAPTGTSGTSATTPASAAASAPTSQAETGRAGHPTVQSFGPQSPSSTASGPGVLPTGASGTTLPAVPTMTTTGLLGQNNPASISQASSSPIAASPSAPGSTSSAGAQTASGSGGLAADTSGGSGIVVMPVGGGDGGIYAQVWRLHPTVPYDAPYGTGGPADDTSDGAPFQTLNALILSYIDSALSSIDPANTSGANDPTSASMTVTAFDGLGTYTFTAGDTYHIDGQYVSGSFSTTDSATFSYSFHEVGYTPDGNQFTLNDAGGGTLNVHADDGNTTTHSLTDTLAASDSYALTQVLNQSDAVAGSFTSAESTTDGIGGADGFTLTETQTETVNSSGSITGGSDSYTYRETGTDTSSLADQDQDTVSGGTGVSDSGTAGTTGADTGGHTYYVVGGDTMGAGGFLPAGTSSFTWGGSDSDSLTTTETDADGVTVSGDGETDSDTTTETTSQSESDGQTGNESYSDSEGTSFSWIETVCYTENSQDQGYDQGTETGGEADADPDGGDAGQDGETFSSTYTDQGQTEPYLSLGVSGTQTLTSGGIITAASTSFNWELLVGFTDTHNETDTDSESGSDSGTEIDSGDTESYSNGETGSDATTGAETNSGLYSLAIDSGAEAEGSYGLVTGGSESVDDLTEPETLSTEQETGGDTQTAIENDTDDTGGDTETEQSRDVETDQETIAANLTDDPVDSAIGVLTLGAGGMVVGDSLSDWLQGYNTATEGETDTDQDTGTESDALADEDDTDSFSDSESDVLQTTETDYDGPTWTEQAATTFGSGGAVAGGNETTSLTDTGLQDYVTTTETDTEINADSSTESIGEGGDIDSTSLTSQESDTDTSTDSDTESGAEKETSSLVQGSAGVVLSGSDYDDDTDTDNFAENDTDTGSATSQDVDIATDDAGGNTSSDSDSTSETDTDSNTDTDAGSDTTTATESLSQGPGGLVTGGKECDTDTEADTSTETDADTSTDADQGSETDYQDEAADTDSDTISETDSDVGTVQETDTDSSSSGEEDSDILGADGDELSGFSTASETDAGPNDTTESDIDIATTTESDSSSETVGGETSTDQDTEIATDSNTETDTENDTPTETEESSETDGAAGMMLSGSNSTSLTDIATDVDTDRDVDIATDTETQSDWQGEGTGNNVGDYALDTSSETSTLTGSDTSTDNDDDDSSVALGLEGETTGGDDQEIETGNDTGSESTTASGRDTYTTTDGDGEADAGDSSTDSDSATGTETSSSSGTSSETSAESESMTDTLGAGAVVTGGSQTETDTDSEGSTLSSTETYGESDSFDDVSDNDEEGDDTDDGEDTGSDTVRETDTEPSKGTDTLAEVIGADGTIASGLESDSLSEASGDTTTETDHPTETVTDAVSDDTMTLTETNTDSDTDNESDQDWAVETLGVSATISGGSDSFTVNDLDVSSYVSSGSGPENYNDTGSAPNGTATVTGSGSSSSLMHQTFGDILGSGGDIASGSLSYTVSSSDTDAATTIESGTETIADELTDGPSQTASYNVSTTTPDDDTAYETGTETLGGGGAISSGSASFTWFEGNSLKRGLTVSGIAAILSITENSTDTYGFGESGTESITTGGADATGIASFVWNQMGTDTYQINQANSETTTTDPASYSLGLTQTVSSSWHDTGADALSNNDTVSGETDTYTWNDLNSLTDSITDMNWHTDTFNGGNSYTYSLTNTLIGGGMESLSVASTGCDSLSAGVTTAESNSFTILDSIYDASAIGDSLSGIILGEAVTESGSVGASDSYSLDDFGYDSLSGSLSLASNSYALDELFLIDAFGSESASGNGGSSLTDNDGLATYSIEAVGTDSLGSADISQSTMSYNAYADGFESNSESASGISIDGTSDPFEGSSVYSYTDSLTEGGTSSESGSHYALSNIATEYTLFTDTGSGNNGGPWSGTNTNELGPWTIVESGNNTSGLTSSTTGYSDTYSDSGSCCGYLPESLPGAYTPSMPEDGTGLLGAVEQDQLAWAHESSSTLPGISQYSDEIIVAVIGSEFYFEDTREGFSIYTPPGLGSYTDVAGLGLFVTGVSSFGPTTDSMTANGLPTQEDYALVVNMAQNQGAPDDVSSSAPPSPTTVLVTLAAAGRNPTDITLPTVGSEASGSGSASGSDRMDVAQGSGSGSGGASGSGVLVAQGALTLSSGTATGSGSSGGAGGGTDQAAPANTAGAGSTASSVGDDDTVVSSSGTTTASASSAPTTSAASSDGTASADGPTGGASAAASPAGAAAAAGSTGAASSGGDDGVVNTSVTTTSDASAGGTSSSASAGGTSSSASSGATTPSASSGGTESAQGSVQAQGDPPPAQGSNLWPNWEGFKAGVSSLGPSSYNVVVGAGKMVWDVGAVPVDFFVGTEYSYYGAASAQALRQGASPSEISAETAMNAGSLGLKPLAESGINYYQTGDPTQFQQTSGSFLLATLAAKGTQSSIAKPLPEGGLPIRPTTVRLPAEAPIVRQPITGIVPEYIPPNRQLPGPGPVGQKALPAPKAPLASVLEGHPAKQGFSGVFDSSTEGIGLAPSTAEKPLPPGFVGRNTGHAPVSQSLGGDIGNHWGFAAILEEDGTLRVTWKSGVLNDTPGNLVPEALRPQIVRAIEAQTGRKVSSY